MSAHRVPPGGRRLKAFAAIPVAGLLLAICAQAAAQTFTGALPNRRFAMPGPSPEARPAVVAPEGEGTEPAVLPSAVVGDEPVATIRDRLVRFPASRQGWRIDGEIGEIDWPLYLSPPEASGSAQLRLTYRTDISVLPDVSRVTAFVNGVAVGSAGGQAASRPRDVVFDLPSGMLKPGFNAVQLRATQRHRVDCSVPATYELWTELDPALSGIVLKGIAATITSLADLPSLPVRSDGALVMRVVVERKLRPADVERRLRATAAIALATRTVHPVVEFGPPSGDAGVNLVFDDPANGDGWPARLGSLVTLSPGIAISPAIVGRAATLVVSGATETEIDAAIERLGQVPAITGSALGRGVAERPFGPSLIGGEHVALSEFGHGSMVFQGRRLSLDLPLVLPTDFFPADYGHAILNVVGEHGPGIGSKAEFLVRVNDRDAASRLIGRPDRAAAFEHMFKLPLSLFRPGPNRVEVTALLPGADADACPAADGDTSDRRFTLSGASSLSLPALARIARAPELASLATGGAMLEKGWALRVVVPRPDRQTLAAAATIAARLAISRGRVPDISFSHEPVLPESGDTLLVSTARALGPAVLAAVGLSGDAMERAWRGRAEEAAQLRLDPVTTGSSGDPNRGGPSACAGHVMRPIERLRPAAAWDPMTTATIARWPVGTDGDSRPHLWSGVETAVFAGARRIEASIRSELDDAMAVAGRRTPSSISPLADDIALFAQGQAGRDGQIYVFTAPDPGDLRAAAECIVSPMRWVGVAGRAVLMRAADGALRGVPAEVTAYSVPNDLGLGNVRLIAAGLLSLHPATFIMLALLLGGMLTLSTRTLVRNVGRRQP